MEFPGGNDNYLTITGPSHPFLSGAETFHTPSLGDEEFEIPPISLDSDPSLAVSDVVGHFDDLADPSSSQDGSFSAQYGVQTLDMPVGMTHGLMEQGGGLLSGGLTMDLDHSIGTQYSANPPVTIDVPMTDMTSGLMGHSQLTTIDQSELSSQLGLSLGGGTILPPAQSPEDRLSTTPSPTSSLHEDGVEDFRRQLPSQKTVVVEAGKKQKTPKKRKKKDPNEPQKPVSAYALFFRDTQAAIKGQNPNATVVTSRGIQLGQSSTATIQPSQQAQIVTRSVLQAAAAAAASMQLPPPRLQPPPLQQMPQPPTQQQVTILQQPPPLQAMQQPPPQKARINLQQQPPPLQIKIVPGPTLKMQTTLVPPAVESSPERPMNNSPEAHTVEETSSETICEMITDVVPEVESPSQMDVELVSGSPMTLSPQPRCVRSGCENPPVVSKDWDNEYCSNECVVKHCRDVFLAWVASRNSNTVVFVK
uniref:TOX high mobility group box family member 4 n=1 Tax=Rousettus aegyptiacus TaxID=9407 RepID=A0A7J8IUI3_ROUAE|nr:TOX high mobility group box family member 4 [Rousettus aegyptiacus]